MVDDYKTAAVIPAYNESERISYVICEVKKYVDSVIVVDDASADTTSQIAADCGADLIRLSSNRGVGYATRIGCDRAYSKGADYIITVDADGQHAPAEIPLLIKELRTRDMDIVFGSRERNSNMPLIKRFGNSALAMLFFLLFRIRINDTQTGFHAFTKDAYKLLRWSSDGYAASTEISVKVKEKNLSFSEVRVSTIYCGKKKGMMLEDGLLVVFLMVFWRFKLL